MKIIILIKITKIIKYICINNFSTTIFSLHKIKTKVKFIINELLTITNYNIYSTVIVLRYNAHGYECGR